jgi:hypothetical protein
MEDIFKYENDNLTITKKQVERIVGRSFDDERQWELFKHNFILKFLCVPRHTLPSYFKWVKNEYQEVISRG